VEAAIPVVQASRHCLISSGPVGPEVGGAQHLIGACLPGRLGHDLDRIARTNDERTPSWLSTLRRQR
jgi:hypothetical protein